MKRIAANRVLAVDGLRVAIATASGPVGILDGLRLTARRGRVLGVVGESGSGKSMTCLACMGLLPPHAVVTGGSIDLCGTELLGLPDAERRRLRMSRMSMVLQNPMAAFNPIRTIGDHLTETIRNRQPVRRSEAWARGIAALDRIGLPRPAELMARRPYELSGGMLQRVMIAIAMSSAPDVLFADEPTTALDPVNQRHVLDELRQLCTSSGTALVIVTHDLGVIAEWADDVVVIHGGRTVESGDVFRIFDNPRHPYTQLLLSRQSGGTR